MRKYSTLGGGKHRGDDRKRRRRNAMLRLPLAALLSVSLAACTGGNAAPDGDGDGAATSSPTASPSPSRPPAKAGDPLEFDRVYALDEVAPIRDTIKVAFDTSNEWYAVDGEVGKQKHIYTWNGAGSRDQYTYSKGELGDGHCSMTITPGVIQPDTTPSPESDEPASVHEQKWWKEYIKDDAKKNSTKKLRKVDDREIDPVVLPLGDGGVEMDSHEYRFNLPGFDILMDPGPQVTRNMVRAFGDTGWVLQLAFSCQGKKFDEERFAEAMEQIHLSVAKPGKDHGFDAVPKLGKNLSLAVGFTQDPALQDVDPVWYNKTDAPGSVTEGCDVTPAVFEPDPRAAKSSSTSDEPGSDIEQEKLVTHYDDKANLKKDGWKARTGAKEGEPVQVRLADAGQTVDFHTFDQTLVDDEGEKLFVFSLRRYFNAPEKVSMGLTLTCDTAKLRDKYRDWVVRATTVTTYEW
jgi:hypothetical protein